jgi:hypothetical protein
MSSPIFEGVRSAHGAQAASLSAPDPHMLGVVSGYAQQELDC